MQLDIFQSNQGDCLLLSGSNGGRVLCDGGMRSSMKGHLRPRLGQLRADGEDLDAVYVSHIDRDHISGVLQLLEDLLEWRVFEHHDSQPGTADVRPPGFLRPPEIKGIWHNAFRDLIGENQGAIEDMMAAAIPVFYGSRINEAVHAAYELENIALSIPEALKVSRLIKADLLDIPLNRLPGRPDPGQLLLIEEPNSPFNIGSLQFQLIGPGKQQLSDLREGWNNWLGDPKNLTRTEVAETEMRRRVNEFVSGNLEGSPFDLGDWNGVSDLRGVTVPNTASLMFLVEDAGHSVLLTGDSQQDIILEGLEETHRLENGEHIHVDVLKVPHHGSEHNADPNFCKRVSADHYVFCGDGSHGNPEPDVLQMYYDSRMGPQNRRALAPEADGRDFSFWFSTTSDYQPEGSADEASFRKTEMKVEKLVNSSNGRLSGHYNRRDWLTLEL
jgi:metallo-beta-lactamase superfamily protein